ncbi:serine--tRNA ligase [Candidatus Azoamicus ciliaticola]|uniref:Serine--tRNA ligase n=1 Tax=Candidatus Azoamicus ciliaticola TaxID=2652803 RepID=A0A6J5JZP5_9GAMM|nr:serine--tRNA ligase [Candidatus Azoamicus ciliaticola]CAB3976437.1 Serine--tRNA ligase [Candidatus Azoamicus ciliaticola]
MINFNLLKYNKDFVIKNFTKRGFDFDYNLFFSYYYRIRVLRTEVYLLQREHNFMSYLVSNYKDYFLFFSFLIIKIKKLKNIIFDKSAKLKVLDDDFNLFLSNIPNLLHNSVPIGKSASDNLEVRTFLNDNFLFNKDLFKDFESNKSFLDFDLAANISGSGFVILKNDLAELHRAIGNYMLDKHIFLHGYKEIYSPVIVNGKSMYCSGHFPKFHDDQFNILDSDLWLIPTAEVVLTNLVCNSYINHCDLPLKFVSKTLCFRKEKGNYGYLVKGIIRQHQFDKVELVNIVDPNKSYDALDELVFHAESILQDLNLSYRVLSLCGSDIGFTSSKTYDLEVWMPKRKIYLEVSSCSNTETFQSRRLNVKFILKNRNFLPHILNGSGLAIGRILLAIIENYSDSFGNIVIPSVLIKYMNGKKNISY